ncbi:FecR domain-containing protein [Candidatus Uhrbacteria bacterium]|nr:FecR domain-containing protein [Candidatus Uhrbacteria bacterium]
MSIRVLTVVVFLGVMGLLALQRFSGTPELTVVVAAVSEESNFHTGEELRRGEVVSTPSGFLELLIGNDTHVYLAAQTQIELHRIFEDEIIVKLKKGRIVVSTESETPVRIITNQTESLIHKSAASFVNYDFLQTVHVIPLSGSVQLTLGDEYLLTPVPISITETDPVSYATLEVNLEAGDSKTFYEWTGVLSTDVLDFSR